MFYNILLKNSDNSTITSENKWEAFFINKTFDWKTIYINTIHASMDVTLRNFQYKFLMRLTPTNKYLYKCKLSQSNLCDFCNMYVESTEHLFWECTSIQIFWNRINKHLTDKGSAINLTFYDICFGVASNSERNKCINAILFNAKYFILKMKLKHSVPNYEHFMNYLQSKLEIEMNIAMKNDKLDQYVRKWSFFQ